MTPRTPRQLDRELGAEHPDGECGVAGCETLNRLDAELTRLRMELELRRNQMDRMGLCPDHRDKFHGRCAACEKEQTETKLETLREGLAALEQVMRRTSEGGYTNGGDAIRWSLKLKALREGGQK